MKNLLRRETTAATEPGPQACGYVEPRQAEARVRIAPLFRDALAGGEFRDVWQNGDVK
jgi:hypothetical protein